MLSSGITELQSSKNIYYLRDAFALEKTHDEASEFFKSLIIKSLNTTATRVNNAIHILAK